MIDIHRQLNAVRRSVGRQTFEARVVTVSQTYATDAVDLWDACTNIERIPRWFLPITGDLQVGGRFQLEGNAAGEVLSCDPPRSYTTTWEAMGATSWVEVTITAAASSESQKRAPSHSTTSCTPTMTTSSGCSSDRERPESVGTPHFSASPAT